MLARPPKEENQLLTSVHIGYYFLGYSLPAGGFFCFVSFGGQFSLGQFAAGSVKGRGTCAKKSGSSGEFQQVSCPSGREEVIRAEQKTRSWWATTQENSHHIVADIYWSCFVAKSGCCLPPDAPFLPFCRKGNENFHATKSWIESRSDNCHVVCFDVKQDPLLTGCQLVYVFTKLL